MPSPKKTRMTALIGSEPAVAAADDATGVVVAFAVRAAVPSSRRLTASTDQANGAAGVSSPPPRPSQDSNVEPAALTELTCDAACGVVSVGSAEAATECGAWAGEASEGAADGVDTSAAVAGPLTDGTIRSDRLLTDAAGVEVLRVEVRAVAGPCPERRCGALAGEFEDPERALERVTGLVVAPEEVGSELADPAEPVVSANAVGAEVMAEPTPRAIAKAPIRPT